ncbi:MAG: oxidoreductase [Desulfobulbaceae bacterium]|nr:oxidoreductase [Desulfobulbaceae bacterium]
MKKYCFVIDVARCENCNNCFLSCKDEHCGNDWPGYSLSQPLHGQRWINISRKERGQFPLIDVAYLPRPCMHCDDAPCIEAAQNGAVYKREDGIVLIDPEKAKGQKNIVEACPYGSIWWNEEEQIPQKCTFCAHLLDQGWKLPRCVQVCPTGALTIQKLGDAELEKLIASENLERLDSSGSGAKPRVFYKNLHRFNSCMIAGSVATGTGDNTECAVGATVKLFQDGNILLEQQTDDFGDFKFDKLDDNIGGLEIEILFDGKSVRKEIGSFDQSIFPGTIWI